MKFLGGLNYFDALHWSIGSNKKSHCAALFASIECEGGKGNENINRGVYRRTAFKFLACVKGRED